MLQLFICWYIAFTNKKCKVLQVFPEKKFDVVLHTFNPRNSKILYINLRIFQSMWGIIFTTMFDNAITKDYHILCLLWSDVLFYFLPDLMHTNFWFSLLLFAFKLRNCLSPSSFLYHFSGITGISEQKNILQTIWQLILFS